MPQDGLPVVGLWSVGLVRAARDARARFGGKFLTPRQAEALFDGTELNVYDNPQAFLTCNYDPAKALCHAERAAKRATGTAPAIDRCNPACANIARTDSHIGLLRTEIAKLAEEAASPLTPAPLRERLAQRCSALRRVVDLHERTKLVPACEERSSP